MEKKKLKVGLEGLKPRQISFPLSCQHELQEREGERGPGGCILGMFCQVI